MLYSPRQSTRRPIRGLRAMAAATYFGTIALRITCLAGNAVEHRPHQPDGVVDGDLRALVALWNSPQAP